MSFVMALALPQIALVAADTRLNILNKDGTSRVNDSGQCSIHYQDGMETILQDSGRKLRRFPGGWAAGVGNFALVHACLTHLSKSNARTPMTIQSTLQQAYQKEHPKIRVAFPDDENTERTAILYTYTMNTKFGLGGVSFTEQMRFDQDADFYLGSPPELPAYDLEHARHKLRQIVPPTDLPGVYAVIRLLADVFHDISAASETVSDIIDIAIMLRTSDVGIIHNRLLASNHNLMNTSNEQVANLIWQV